MVEFTIEPGGDMGADFLRMEEVFFFKGFPQQGRGRLQQKGVPPGQRGEEGFFFGIEPVFGAGEQRVGVLDGSSLLLRSA